MAGVDREYDIEVDEKEAEWGNVDPVRGPGYYVRRDPSAIESASDHVIATGMLLKHCGLKAGDWALEYGAGFGQSALALARMGVNVDTVDVSDVFCGFVREQAEFFRVPLEPFKGRFGDAPRPGRRYDLIWFYESFHHCLDFANVVRRLGDLLAPGGRVILGGEPIVERPYAAVPYPWGLRLHSEVAAVVRQQRWFELGFTDDFLFELFAQAGFVMRRVDCEPSLFGRLYVCDYRPAEVDLTHQWMPPELARGWRASGPAGRGIADASRWPLERTDTDRTIDVVLTNPGRANARVEVDAGARAEVVEVPAGGSRTVDLTVLAGAQALTLRARSTPRWWHTIGRRCGGVAVTTVRSSPQSDVCR